MKSPEYHKDRSVINKLLKKLDDTIWWNHYWKITLKEQIIFYWNNLSFYSKIVEDTTYFHDKFWKIAGLFNIYDFLCKFVLVTKYSQFGDNGVESLLTFVTFLYNVLFELPFSNFLSYCTRFSASKTNDGFPDGLHDWAVDQLYRFYSIINSWTKLMLYLTNAMAKLKQHYNTHLLFALSFD